MRNKKVISIAFVLLLIFVVGSSLNEKEVEKEVLFSSFYPGELSKVTQIVIDNRMEGKKRVITNSKEIRAWVDTINKVPFIIDKNQEPRTGSATFITFFENGKQTFQFHPHTFNGKYYSSTASVVLRKLYNTD